MSAYVCPKCKGKVLIEPKIEPKYCKECGKQINERTRELYYQCTECKALYPIHYPLYDTGSYPVTYLEEWKDGQN